MKSRKKRLREVYVWELPVRIYHWAVSYTHLTLPTIA